jgi:hypothetical protein
LNSAAAPPIPPMSTLFAHHPRGQSLRAAARLQFLIGN